MPNYIPSFDEYLNESSEDRRTPEEKIRDGIAALKQSIDKLLNSCKENPEKIPIFKAQIAVLNAKINVFNAQTNLRRVQKNYTYSK
jgi:peptidoglycan hydrolase CwlO-like protein